MAFKKKDDVQRSQMNWQEVAKAAGLPKYKPRNFDLTNFICSPAFAQYPTEFQKDFLESVGSGTPTANTYRRIRIAQSHIQQGLHLPQFADRLLASVDISTGDLSYIFDNVATGQQKKPLLPYSNSNYVFQLIKNWESETEWLYSKWCMANGVQPSKIKTETTKPKKTKEATEKPETTENE